MEVFFGLIAVFWLIGVVTKALGLDEESKQKQQEDAARNAAYELLGGSIGRVAVIGMYAAGSDGTTAQAERTVVMKWLNGRIDDLKQEHQARMRHEAEKVLNAAGSRITEQDMTRAANGIPADLGSMRQDAMQLAFNVVAADGVLEPAEYQALLSIQRALSITDSRFRDLYDIHLANLRREGTSGTTATVDELGMNPSWSKDQKLAHLTKEFAKYSNRMQSAKDQTQRDYCKRMLDLITRAREQIMGTAKPANQDEVLLGIESSLGVSDKRALLDKEEERWLARQRITQNQDALQKCRDALAAISRLRLLYADA